MELLPAITANLLSPAVLFFALGLVAALTGSATGTARTAI